MDYGAMLAVALEEARAGFAEGGIPIGAALFDRAGNLLGRGHNRRVQDDDPFVHGETDAFRNAGRRRLAARGRGGGRRPRLGGLLRTAAVLHHRAPGSLERGHRRMKRLLLALMLCALVAAPARAQKASDPACDPTTPAAMQLSGLP